MITQDLVDTFGEVRLTCVDRESNEGIIYMAGAGHKVEQLENRSKKGASNVNISRHEEDYWAKSNISSSGCDFIQPCALMFPCW